MLVYLRSKVTTKDDACGNSLELGESINLLQSSVVLDSKITNLGQQWERDISKLLVVDKGNTVGNGGEILGSERGKLRVLVELDRLGDLGQVGHIEGHDIGNLDLACRLKLRKIHLHRIAVATDGEESGDAGKIRIVGGQLVVVDDLEGIDSVDVKTAQIAEESVDNLNGRGLADTRSTECQLAQLGKLDERNFIDALQ